MKRLWILIAVEVDSVVRIFEILLDFITQNLTVGLGHVKSLVEYT